MAASDMLFYILLCGGSMALGFTVVTIFQLVKRRKVKQANADACKALAEKAHERLRNYEPMTERDRKRERDAIDSALNKGWVHHLAAYANLIGECDSIYITMAVFKIEHEALAGEVTVTPETLTAEQVAAYNEAKAATDVDEDSVISLGSNSADVGYYVMENMADYPLIRSIVEDRKIKKLDEIKSVVAAMKTSTSGALADGAL